MKLHQLDGEWLRIETDLLLYSLSSIRTKQIQINVGYLTHKDQEEGNSRTSFVSLGNLFTL